MSVQLNPIADQSVRLQPVTAVMEHDLRGVVIRDKILPVVFRDLHDNPLPSIKCTVQDRVVKSTDTGHFHFVQRIRYQSNGWHNTIWQAWRRNFPTSVFLGWRPDGLGEVQPTTATREARVVQIIFQLGGPYSPYPHGISPGKESRFFYIKTEATDHNVLGETTLVLATGEKASITTAQPV